MPIQEDVVSALVPHMRERGFRKRRSNWFRTRAGFYCVLSVQKSSWGDDTAHINLGCSPAELVHGTWLPENCTHIRFRLDPMLADDAAMVLRERERGRFDARRVARLVEDEVVPRVLDVIDATTTLPDLAGLVARTGNVFVHKDVRPLLGAT